MNNLLYYTQLTKTTSILTQLDALYGQFQADTSFLRTKQRTKIHHTQKQAYKNTPYSETSL